MTAIEKLKHNGAAKALSERIETLRFALTNRNWDGIKDGTSYIRLGDAMADARSILDEMDQAFSALKEMEPSNR